MIDMTSTIEPKSDQLNSDSLLSGPMTIKIVKVSANPDSSEQPISIFYAEDMSRPFKPCKTIRRLLVALWGKDATRYVGRSLTLYRDPTVKFGGMEVGGIRCSHMSHIEKQVSVALTATRGSKKITTVKPLVVEIPRQDTKPTDAPKAADPYAPYSREFKHMLDTKPWQDVNDWWVETEARREGMAADRVANMSAALADKMNAALAAKIEKENA